MQIIPPGEQGAKRSLFQARPTRQFSDLSQLESSQISAQRERNRSVDSSKQNHGQQRQQYEARDIGNKDIAGLGGNSRISAKEKTLIPAVLIASPANQSLSGVFATKSLCDLHLIAPGQVTRILVAS